MAGNYLRDMAAFMGWKPKTTTDSPDQTPQQKPENKEFTKLPNDRFMILIKGKTLPKRLHMEGQTTADDEVVRISGETDTDYVGSYGDNEVGVFYSKDTLRPLTPDEIEEARSSKKSVTGFSNIDDNGNIKTIPGLFEQMQKMVENKEKVWIKRTNGDWTEATADNLGIGAVNVVWYDDVRQKMVSKPINPSELLAWQTEHQ